LYFRCVFQESAPTRYSTNRRDQFPHGPRKLDLDSEAEKAEAPSEKSEKPERNPRRRRSVVVSDRQTRSADVGVSGLYEVISEADLAFTPGSETRESVIVFQGRIREEVSTKHLFMLTSCLWIGHRAAPAANCSNRLKFLYIARKRTLHVSYIGQKRCNWVSLVTALLKDKLKYSCLFGKRVAVISAKNHKRQRRKRQSVTAKREKSQTPKVLTAILTLPNLT